MKSVLDSCLFFCYKNIMSRPLRIEYKDAWYHAMNRGRNREVIFHDKYDYRIFIELLKETSEMWNFHISAYCLMPNHYHLLIQTPDANLSRGVIGVKSVLDTCLFFCYKNFMSRPLRIEYKDAWNRGQVCS